jgi:hypothetical protein
MKGYGTKMQIACKSGRWFEKDVFQGTGDNYWIPKGITVKVDGFFKEQIVYCNNIVVDGSLIVTARRFIIQFIDGKYDKELYIKGYLKADYHFISKIWRKLIHATN